jgi:hypothetical protein
VNTFGKPWSVDEIGHEVRVGDRGPITPPWPEEGPPPTDGGGKRHDNTNSCRLSFHRTLAQLQVYTKEVDRKKLADKAIKKHIKNG